MESHTTHCGHAWHLGKKVFVVSGEARVITVFWLTATNDLGLSGRLNGWIDSSMRKEEHARPRWTVQITVSMSNQQTKERKKERKKRKDGRLLKWNPKWYSHKYEGPGVRYEAAINIQTGDIVYQRRQRQKLHSTYLMNAVREILLLSPFTTSAQI